MAETATPLQAQNQFSPCNNENLSLLQPLIFYNFMISYVFIVPFVCRLSIVKVAVFSGLGAWMSDLIMYPMDTISTKIKAHTKEFLSFKEGYKLVVRTGGGNRALFNGFSTTFPCSFIPALIYFMAYENMNKWGMKKIKEIESESMKTVLKLAMPFLTSSLSEIICLIPYMPFDVVRTRLQVNDANFQYKSVFHGLREVVEKEGLIRLYKASHIYIATTTIQTGLFFWCYETQRYYLLHDSKKHDGARHKLSIVQSLAVSLISSLTSTFLVNPLDLILTRYQVIDSTKHHLSVKQIAKDLVKNEGYVAFFKGLTARLMISCAYSVLYMPVYEHFKALYGVDMSEDD